MATEVKLPRLGQGMESGTIVRWLKSEGDAVAKREPLYELDTDKVTQEVEAEADGVLLKIVVSEGEVEVGRTIAVIGKEGESVSIAPAIEAANERAGSRPVAVAAPGAQTLVAPAPSGSEPQGTAPAESPSEPGGSEPQGTAPAEPPSEPGGSEPQATAPAESPSEPSGSEPQATAPAESPSEPSGSEPQGASAAEDGRVKASPLARRIARERGIDLAAVAGTGPDGRVIAEDVEKIKAGTMAVADPSSGTAVERDVDVEIVQLSSTRKTIARRLTEAWTAPVFQLGVSADMTEALALREQLVARVGEGGAKPTVNDVLTKLVAVALTRHRAVNAVFADDAIHRFARAHVAIAVAAPNGLVVPVIHDADRHTIQEIANARADLVGRAKDGKLVRGDLEGGTFTISNLGMFGVEQFVAILNPPQVAILAVGAVKETAVVVDGEIDIAPVLQLTLTCDHRAIDGAEGAEFLRTLVVLVEQPALAL